MTPERREEIRKQANAIVQRWDISLQPLIEQFALDVWDEAIEAAKEKVIESLHRGHISTLPILISSLKAKGEK